MRENICGGNRLVEGYGLMKCPRYDDGNGDIIPGGCAGLSGYAYCNDQNGNCISNDAVDAMREEDSGSICTTQ